ncbi:MAG: tRNA (N(6)-L-threonylcarbamoyladenosine(37)-C(2))-methylthiotransferase MtaB [Clostridiales bacterium]|nr:tRNA (N(6)-L-threonylcarbamoyladenosine(37)-C(2))-methylthiotransferase MtaB [Clostridiales bacterium]
MRFAIYTLGCKVNQYESQAMETILEGQGHTLVPFEEEAELYLINTCSVTAVSDKKSRQTIRRTRREHPDAVIAVCGCYAQASPEQVAELGVDFVSGTGDRLAFLEQVQQEVDRRQAWVQVDDPFRRTGFEVLPAGGLEGRTRAMLKVQDGCRNFCTYCIIPYTRGALRSEPLESAVEQARRLAEQGYREIVLTGIEISSWGVEWKDGSSLIDLIEALCQAVPHLRIRLGSLEPRTITEDFCRRAAVLPNLCPHFHLSLQSGCDAVLKRMHRRYDTARFLESCRLLRTYFDRPAITTDLIVGFPGETEEEFDETLAFLERAAFSAMHIFPYSRRPGTPAARMEGQISNAVKEERAHRAAQVASALEQSYLASWVGEALPVLLEEQRDGLWQGHAPNYVQVRTSAEGNWHNVMADVRITGVGEGYLVGEMASKGD